MLMSHPIHSYQHQAMYKTTVGNGSRYVPLDADNLARRLLVLTNFYLNAHDESPLDVAELGQLHWLLDSYYNGSGYSVHDILRDLSPDCGDLVPRGLIYGAPVNTSQLFLKRSTTASVCCIFNYRRPSYSHARRAQDDAEMSALPQVVFESNSILNGIQFVLQDIKEDDLTERYLSNTAFRLMIFPQEDYATVQSNKHGELLVDHNTIVEVPIQPKFFDSSNAVRGVTPQTRRCYFPEEGRQLLNQSYYSLDECMLLCRIESMVQHCGCVSSPMAGTARNVSYCTLLDLPCLMKWRNIWHGYNEYPYVQEDAASISQCLHCLPTCDGVNFEIISNVAPLRKSYNSSGYNRGLLKGLNNDRPLSIIKLFFKLRFAQATQMDMVGDWVVLLNRFGGILSLMAYNSSKESSSKVNELNKSINWNELMPHGMEWFWRQELQQQPPEK
ncbi:pickpocket protein 11 isoform X2 [Drosophila virilis]|uniref:pickpocket protein 11 isoform X2 n=1 Tax=Drosophila virilis TaxID=7244 RepID=UPI0038B3A632